MPDNHICTADAPYRYELHGYNVEHPHRTYQRDIASPRGGKRMAMYRCDHCGARFTDDLPEWAKVPLGVIKIPKAEPPPPRVIEVERKRKRPRINLVSSEVTRRVEVDQEGD